MARVLAAPGLSADEAAQRLAADGPNELPAERPRGFLTLTWSVLREPMLLLLLAAAAISFLLAEAADAIILLLSVLIVALISLYQQRKTENALNALRQLSAPRALLTRRNPALLIVIGIAVAMLVLLIGVPPIREALALGALTPLEWALAISAGLASVAWFEAYRWLRRRGT